MRVLFIAPLPPPITGHSIVSKALFDELEKTHDQVLVNMSKESFKDGIDGTKRIFQILGVLKDVFIKKKNTDVIYITIAESLAGNIKDLLIYLICFPKLKKMYVHLHGGTIKKVLWDKYPKLFKLNRFFIRRMAGAIISGKGHLPIFNDILPLNKIFMVPNFSHDDLFVSHADIDNKFKNGPLKVLYMSNLIPKKGYLDLLKAFLSLPFDFQKRIKIDFAGGFESEKHKREFLHLIADHEQLKYNGIVSGEEKRLLFADAQIFCLPTSLFEGQPISILEAYASGCVVLTTGQPGIYDIFENGINGFEIQPESSESIKDKLRNILDSFEELKQIAHYNLTNATLKYRKSIYTAALVKILESGNIEAR